MSEAELHILRARLDGGIRNKAARGELRRGLPVGLVWGERDGEIRLHPDEAVTSAIRTVFERFAELGSVRRVWLWFRAEELTFPLRLNYGDIRWVPPSYHAIHQVLTNPAYAGAYTYGKSRQERHVDENGVVRKRVRQLPRSEWPVLITEHHPGYVDWPTYEENLKRIAGNTRPLPHAAGGAVREGSALLQGIATCGHCGRRLHTHYRGRNVSPGYHCPGKDLVQGRGVYCLNIGGVQIDRAVSEALLDAMQPAGLQAALCAAERIEADHDGALEQWRLAVERARYQAERAERRYRVVEPENRLVARGLETDWEQRLSELAKARAELERRERRRPCELTTDERRAVLALGTDLQRVWNAPTTTERDKKELLRTLLEEVIVAAPRGGHAAHLTLRWRGGTLAEIEIDRPRTRQAPIRTDEDTVDLVRRLARHYPDAVIAGILNRQGKATAYGHRFNAMHVGNLRRNWNLVETRTQSRPRNQMARTGKLRHVHADLGEDHPRDRLTDPGHRLQPVGGLAKRAQDLVGLPLQLPDGGLQRIDLRQVQLQQEPMMGRHPAMHRGDDVRATGLQAPGGAIGQPLGIGLPGDERREDRSAADAQDVGDHPRQLHVRVFQRLLQALRVPRDLADQLLAGPRQVPQFLNRGRRHEAAPNQPVRQQVRDPGRIVPVALAARTFRICWALASTSVNDSSRMCHTGFQYTPVASIATCVQPASVRHAASSSRPAVVVANSRCSVVTVRPAATRTQAFTRREWTSNPAHRGYKTSIRHLLLDKGAGVESAGTKSTGRAHRAIRCRNTGCSRDSGSNYPTGSRHHPKTDLCASVSPYTVSLFHEYVGPAPPGEQLSWWSGMRSGGCGSVEPCEPSPPVPLHRSRRRMRRRTPSSLRPKPTSLRAKPCK